MTFAPCAVLLKPFPLAIRPLRCPTGIKELAQIVTPKYWFELRSRPSSASHLDRSRRRTVQSLPRSNDVSTSCSVTARRHGVFTSMTNGEVIVHWIDPIIAPLDVVETLPTCMGSVAVTGS